MKEYLKKFNHLLNTHLQKRKLYNSFPRKTMNPIVAANRHALESISNWIPDKLLETSNFNYGIQSQDLQRINLPIDTYYTYSDIMIFLSHCLSNPISYLEIGISVGKHFWQLCNYWDNAYMAAIDIEEPNPSIISHWIKEDAFYWETYGTAKKEKPSKTTFTYNGNIIDYVAADEFDPTAWKQLQSKKFNIIFSDALHTPGAIWHEYQMMKQMNLMHQKEILMIWDDLGGEMTDMFIKIYEDMKSSYNTLYKNTFITNGWMNYKYHNIGIISSFPI